jgi:3-methyl-2-oxobutanoate hydroxymethyltransferase
MMGLFEKFTPKFVKQYRNLADEMVSALNTFKEEIRSGAFPEEKHVFGGVGEEELKRLY